MAKIKQELITASQKASQLYGIPASVILGFAGYETSYGTAGVGASKNNAFGIMSNGSGKRYASLTDSVMDFARLVTGNKDSSQSRKYGEATANAKTNAEWVNAIRDAGYNSEYADGVYESRIMQMIKNDDLNQYNVSGYAPTDVSGEGFSDGSQDETSTGLNWWGDIVKVVFCILLILGGVIFTGLAVTSNSTGLSIFNMAKSVITKKLPKVGKATKEVAEDVVEEVVE